MEVAALAACLNTLLPKLWEHRKEKKKERIAIEIDIQDIRTAIRGLDAAFEDAKLKGDGTGSAAATELKHQAREFCQQIQDSIQRFFITKKDTDCTAFAMTTKAHKEKLQELCERLEKLSSEQTVCEKPPDPFVADPMDIGEPKTELLELVKLPGSRPSEGRRKVVSIVGFGGLGKTLLAQLIYDKDKDKDRPAPVHPSLPGTSTPPVDCTLRARVTAAAEKPEKVLTEILEQLDAAGKDESLNSVEKYGNLKLDELGKRLAERLRKKRYFIVIDDMQSQEQWKSINDAFPMDGNGDSTIIVTTTIKSVADACSSRNGYVYKLSPLDKNKSLDLFMKDRVWDRKLTVRNASDILKKCEGLPLAIVSMSQSLEGPEVLTSDVCEAACKRLGADLVQENGGLKRLRWVLMNKYTSLTGYNLRACLLYFCMYKHNMGAVPKRNSLIRRWEAEGFLVDKHHPRLRPTDVGAKNLETLVDRNIIQPMEVGINGAARRCRPPGMMLEYISQISMSENFAALVCDAVEMGDSRIRRLSFDAGSAADDRKISMMELSNVLTLAVSGDGCEAILTFKKYELIAVLDLKECTNLEESHVEDICKLVLLKYLSLGDSIGEIPHKIKQLKMLETLEMRTKGTVKVCREVLELPNLKHLLGNFMLRGHADTKLCTFLEKDSGLETVTGFVTKETKGFPKLMCKMRRLMKVKIYCAPNATKSDLEDLPAAIKAFTAEVMNIKHEEFYTHSLSIDFAQFPGGREGLPIPLEFLKHEGSVGSLKLVGDWRPYMHSKSRAIPDITNDIPDFTKVSGIKKLCLSRTYLSGNDVLARLTSLIALVYLKLDEQVLGPLEIKPDTLQNLTHLCLVGETSLHSITIQPGALPSLISLHLICEALQPGLQSSIGIGSIKYLKEIALDSQVTIQIKDAWKEAAKGHPNRPQVLLI